MGTGIRCLDSPDLNGEMWMRRRADNQHLFTEELEVVLRAARRAAWIGRDARLSAVRNSKGITVVLTSPAATKYKTYRREEAWLYDFLRELAHGEWKTDERERGD
jgi:hypothetical protein